ncbi:MAG: glycoside hydrolase family 5 protein, partial [Planctomycetes bacterium]|nr:glycoside hydrolase family 5 protein [Planctomycetota bacterium]
DQTLGRRREEVQADYDKFIPLVYDHYEKIARQLGGRAFWEVAYDLVNEPFDHKHQKYNPAMKELTRRVRAIDRRHLLYIEPCEAWGAIQQMALVEPTGDPLTAYSFHDYNFRLHRPADRWPTLEKDITNIYQMWLPAIVFQIKHGVCLHCGEFGGFAESTNDTLAQALLMNDFFRIFDQFGMHHHYYTGRGIYERPADGSLRPSNVARAYRAYFGRGDFNIYYKKWPGHRDAR